MSRLGSRAYNCSGLIFLYNAFTREIVNLGLYRKLERKYRFTYGPTLHAFTVYARHTDMRKNDEIVID